MFGVKFHLPGSLKVPIAESKLEWEVNSFPLPVVELQAPCRDVQLGRVVVGVSWGFAGRCSASLSLKQ